MIKQKKKATLKQNEQIKAIAELIVEDFRFRRSYLLILDKLFVEEKKRYESAYEFHSNKIMELTKYLGLNIKTYDGWDYNEGLPITPLNADEFNSIENLYVYQTLEPTILANEGDIVKQGTVVLAIKKQDKDN